MAVRVELTNKTTGLNATGYLGFSWTSLLFSMWPCAFRGDWYAFFIYLAISVIGGALTAGIAAIILWLAWPFFYNKWHIRRLVAQGYEITAAAGMSVENAKAIVNG